MADFDKVTGSNGAQTNLNFLRSEVVRLGNERNALNNELIARAAPRVGELIDAVTHMTDAAVAGHPVAKQILRKLIDSLDRARESSSVITVVHGNGKPD